LVALAVVSTVADWVTVARESWKCWVMLESELTVTVCWKVAKPGEAMLRT